MFISISTHFKRPSFRISRDIAARTCTTTPDIWLLSHAHKAWHDAVQRVDVADKAAKYLAHGQVHTFPAQMVAVKLAADGLAQTNATLHSGDMYADAILQAFTRVNCPFHLAALRWALQIAGSGRADAVSLLGRELPCEAVRGAVLQHIAVTASTLPDAVVKPLIIVSDFDDTLVANLLDRRLPRGAVYPGVTVLLQELVQHRLRASLASPSPALRAQPDAVPMASATWWHDWLAGAAPSAWISEMPPAQALAQCSHLNVLTARPDGPRGVLRRLTQRSIAGIAVPPTALTHGTLRGATSLAGIASVKLRNMTRIASLWPEADFVVLGDSGQADAAFMLKAKARHPGAVQSCLLHHVTTSRMTGDGTPLSQAIDAGMVVHRTHIQAAAALAAQHPSLLSSDAAQRVASSATEGMLGLLDSHTTMAGKAWSTVRQAWSASTQLSAAEAPTDDEPTTPAQFEQSVAESQEGLVWSDSEDDEASANGAKADATEATASAPGNFMQRVSAGVSARTRGRRIRKCAGYMQQLIADAKQCHTDPSEVAKLQDELASMDLPQQ